MAKKNAKRRKIGGQDFENLILCTGFLHIPTYFTRKLASWTILSDISEEITNVFRMIGSLMLPDYLQFLPKRLGFLARRGRFLKISENSLTFFVGLTDSLMASLAKHSFDCQA
jgi:hypothetical protein